MPCADVRHPRAAVCDNTIGWQLGSFTSRHAALAKGEDTMAQLLRRDGVNCALLVYNP